MTDVVRRVARNAAWLAAGEGSVKGALFLTAVIVAHGAGPEGMGTFVIAYSAALLAVLVLAAGQQEVVIREVAASPENADLLLRAARTVQNRLASWLVPTAMLATFLVHDQSLRYSLLAFIPYSLLRAVLVTHGAMFKGLDQMDMEVRARTIEVVIVLLLLTASVFWCLEIWTVGIAFSVGAGAGLVWLRKGSRLLRKPESDPQKQTKDHQESSQFWRNLRLEGLPFLAIAVMAQLLLRADTFLLAMLKVPRPEIGFYGAAGAPVWGIVALPQLLSMSFYPTLSRRAAEKGKAWPAVVAASAGGMALGLALGVFLFIIRHPLVEIAFGPEFERAVPLLSRLIWILPATVTMTFLGTVLAAWHRQKWSLGVLSAVLIVSFSLNLMWIPQHGPIGAATAAIWAHWFGVIILFALTVRLLIVPRETS
ncbi:MAG: oligosaccharide flippase family protein [Thermoanaerobaculales bacterium]|nr:oligosaccharide flippase family protein [Thermoanaerobaculales bacterium]